MRASEEPPGRHSARTEAELLAMPDDEFAEATADIAALLAEGPVEIEPIAPSPGLWDAIAAAVAAEQPAGLDGTTDIGSGIRVLGTEPSDPTAASHGVERHAPVIDPLEETEVSSPASSRARSRWGGRAALITLVAAVVLLVLVPVGLSIGSDRDEPVVLARAELEVLTGDATGGSAELLDEESDVLRVDVEATAPEGEYLELWLLSLDDNGLAADPVSLGRIEDSGTFAIPADVDTAVFDVVDVSIEADDGDATHSGKSVLRGPLT